MKEKLILDESLFNEEKTNIEKIMDTFGDLKEEPKAKANANGKTNMKKILDIAGGQKEKPKVETSTDGKTNMKKIMDVLNKKLNEDVDADDGWEKVRELEDYKQLETDTQSLFYEIDNCTRGWYTQADDYYGLAGCFENLGDDLKNFAKEIESLASMTESAGTKKCVICGKEFTGYGNNAEPVKSGTCCDECNAKVVVPARLKKLRLVKKNENLDNAKVEDKAREVVDPTYADAIRKNEENKKVRDAVTKMTKDGVPELKLEESLFEDINGKHVFYQVPDEELDNYDVNGRVFDDDGLYGINNDDGIIIDGGHDFQTLIYSRNHNKEIDDLLDGFIYPDKVCAELNKITGKKYVHDQFTGYSQSDCVNVYYPVGEFSEDWVKYLSDMYMGCYDVYREEDGSNVTFVADSDKRTTKGVIADETGYDPNQIIIKRFTGYTKTPNYEDDED